jgi:hypothetical protein
MNSEIQKTKASTSIIINQCSFAFKEEFVPMQKEHAKDEEL